MNVTVYRHEAYDKFLVTVENGVNVDTYTLYDMTVKELAEFVGSLHKEDK